VSFSDIPCPSQQVNSVLVCSKAIDMEPPTENEQLFEAARQGDSEALGQLLEHFRVQLRENIHHDLQNQLHRRVGESDIIQQSCLQATQQFFTQFRGTTLAEFWGWLQQIQRNTLVDQVRNNHAQKRDARRERSGANLNQALGKITSPSQKAVRSESQQQLDRAIEMLPEEQSRAVRMRHLDGLHIRDIAVAMGKSESATAKLITRGMSALKELLKE